MLVLVLPVAGLTLRDSMMLCDINVSSDSDTSHDSAEHTHRVHKHEHHKHVDRVFRKMFSKPKVLGAEGQGATDPAALGTDRGGGMKAAPSGRYSHRETATSRSREADSSGG